MKHDVFCVINRRDRLGETPLWCGHSGTLWWLDIERPRLQSFNPGTGTYTIHPFSSKYAGSVAFNSKGGFIVALDNSLYEFDPTTDKLEHYLDIETANNGARLNDGRCDRRGRLWIGTMDEAFKSPLGSVYLVDEERSVERMFGDIIVTNSIVISPDDRVLYVSDTRRYVMWAFDLDFDAGILTNRRVFADYNGARGRPDGSCVDSEGCVWNAAFAGGCVIRYTPEGKIDTIIDLPVTNPTCVCLGDDDLRTLYITTATKMLEPAQLAREPFSGSVLAVRVDVPGLPEAAFGEASGGGTHLEGTT
jgi:sugar lactone lactonase YvrE